MKAGIRAAVVWLFALTWMPLKAEIVYLDPLGWDPPGWERLRRSLLHTPPPTAPSVSRDLALVARDNGRAAREATMRLMDSGPSALPEVHAALLDPDFPDERKPSLLFVIAAIADASSASPVLSFGSARSETHGQLLECLRRLQGSTPDADTFALARVADTDADPYVRQRAMIYLADRGRPEAARWADTFRADPSPDFQAVALYADAMVDRPGTQAGLVHLINTGTSSNLRWPLYVSLSRLASPEAFDSELRSEVHDSTRFEKAQKLAQMRTLSGRARTDFAIDMFLYGDAEMTILALRDVIARGDQDRLVPYAHSSVPLDLALWVRRELRLAGFRVVEGETVRVVPKSR